MLSLPPRADAVSQPRFKDANDHPGVGTYDHDHDGIANRSLREARNCKTKTPSKPAERGGWALSAKGDGAQLGDRLY